MLDPEFRRSACCQTGKIPPAQPQAQPPALPPLAQTFGDAGKRDDRWRYGFCSWNRCPTTTGGVDTDLTVPSATELGLVPSGSAQSYLNTVSYEGCRSAGIRDRPGIVDNPTGVSLLLSGGIDLAIIDPNYGLLGAGRVPALRL